MSDVLDKMISESRKGYVDDGKEIESVMNALGRMTVSELVTMVGAECKRHIENLGPGILKDEYELEMDLVTAERLKLTDLMCLVEYTKLDGSGNEDPADGIAYTDEELVYIQPYRYAGIFYLNELFQEAQRTNYSFKAFSAFQMKAFCNYLDFCHYQTSASYDLELHLYETLQARTASAQIDLAASDTVGNILNRANGVQRVPWSPWRSMEAYRRRNLTAYRISAELLLGSFRYAFPKAFDLEAVLERCRFLIKTKRKKKYVVL